MTTLADAVVQLAKHAPTPAEQMIPAPIPVDVEERASPRKLQPELNISKAEDHPSEAQVGKSVDYR